jgi:hypothetical protein
MGEAEVNETLGRLLKRLPQEEIQSVIDTFKYQEINEMDILYYIISRESGESDLKNIGIKIGPRVLIVRGVRELMSNNPRRLPFTVI